MGSSRFTGRLAAHLAALLALMAAIARLAAFGEAPMTTFLAIVASLLVAASLWHLIDATNRELERFVVALERADLAQSFRREGRGVGFDRLGVAFDGVVERLRAERASGVGVTRYADALVDGAPTALLVIGPGEEVAFANKAARRLFARDRSAALPMLAPLGQGLVETLRRLSPGTTASTHMIVDGLSQRVALDATAIDLPSGSRRVVSLRAIQGEIDEAQLAAQIDLVRVLTHEVMNSLTPVTSLAATAERLIGEVDPAAAPAIGKAQRAIAALARRAGELERFVDSYKDFSAAPALHRLPVDVADWLDEVVGLFAATPAAADVVLSWPRGEPLGTIAIDRGLMTQVLLNLLKNAVEAVAGIDGAAIAIEAMPTASNRLRLIVADNGPGLDPAIAGDAFLPFFTTKPAGTGVGLSFARKVVLLHGGQIGFAPGPGGQVELLLPIG